MYRTTSSIHVHFSHHVRGHEGPCISIHGHTWCFEIVLEARELDAQGFVVDFDLVHERLLVPCHRLLDHSLAVGEKTWIEARELLAPLGKALVASRKETLGGSGEQPAGLEGALAGARNEYPGGIKVAVFPFTPTSERLAEWLYRAGTSTFADDRVRVACGRVYETVRPTETVAEYWAGT
jgi:6-pyruvoyl-tetrahydropterin synthase